MKTKLIFIYLLVTLIITQVAMGQDVDFYEELLNSNCRRNCPFLVLEIKSEGYKGDIVANVADIYEMLGKMKGFSDEEVKPFVKDMLVNKKSLVLKEYDVSTNEAFVNIVGFSSNKLRKYRRIKELDKIAANGCVSFISYYFLEQQETVEEPSKTPSCKALVRKLSGSNGLMLRKSLGFVGETALIEKLFKWKILTQFDDIKGTLVI